MKLSEQLKQDNDCGDFGKALSGYSERAALLEDAVVAMAEDGWLYHGQEGMSEAQEKCYAAYLSVKLPNVAIEGLEQAQLANGTARMEGSTP